MPENFFISYATRDAQQFALRLHDELEMDGFHAWLDKRDIRATENWSQAIKQGLRECIGVLVILTPAAIASTVCQNELSLAHTLKKPLLPILITPETPDAQPLAGDLIPLVLQAKQYISFVSSFEQGIAKLRPALHRILALTRSIDAKQQQIADLEQKRPDAPRPQALERAIEDLQGDISNRQRVLVDPEAYLDAYRQSTETEIESNRQSALLDPETLKSISEPLTENKAYVFISYHRQSSQDYARKLADYLITNGFDVWIDDHIDFGKRWEREIYKAIEGCAAFVVIMTPDAWDSEWVNREYLYADRLKKPAFPLLLKGDNFPFYTGVQFTDVNGERLPSPSFFDALTKAGASRRIG